MKDKNKKTNDNIEKKENPSESVEVKTDKFKEKNKQTNKTYFYFILCALVFFCLGWFISNERNHFALPNVSNLPKEETATTSQASVQSEDIDSESVDADDQSITSDDLFILMQTYQTIKDEYIKDVDKNRLLEGALKGMVGALDDPYSEYLNIQEMTDLDDNIDGSFSGIGVEMMSKSGVITVISPIDDTPADKAGIQPNDVLLEADGKELTDMDTQEVVGLIRGEIGTSVTLKVQRGESTFDVTLTREEIPLITVKAEVDKKDPKIGIINVKNFSMSTAEELQDAIKELDSKGVERYVFDLRNNPGGLLDQALEIGNMFSKEGQTLMQIENGDGTKETIEASEKYGTFKIDKPFVMLINDGSASASEIVAAIVQENTSSPLIGDKSFGKGTVQSIVNETDLGELKLTIAKWLTPNGTWINEKGLEPNVKQEQLPLANSIMLNMEETLKKESTGELVKSASQILEALGYDVKETEYYNDKMVNAVKAFQKDHNLKQDGEITGETAYQMNDSAREYLIEHDIQLDKAIETVKEQ